MKVLHLLDTLPFAGTEQHVVTLAKALQGTEGMEPKVGCRQGSQLQHKSRQAGLEAIPLFRGKNAVLQAVALTRLLRLEPADILHCHNGRTLLSAYLASLKSPARLVYTQHFLQPGFQTHPAPVRLLYRLAHCTVNSRVSRFIAVSAEAARRMAEREGVPEERISVIPNGISPDLSALRPAAEVRSALGIPEDAPLAVCVSRLEKEKDVGTLVRAMAGVRRTLPRARCVVVGDGSQRRALEALRDEEGLGDAVLFAGHQPDALSIIGASDLLVLPSLAEPFGLVLLEAMALCKAVVATDAGGPREIVVNGETGVLAPPGDADAMAEAIAGLLSDPETARAMGREGRRRYLELYTAERMARDTLAVYRQVLEEG